MQAIRRAVLIAASVTSASVAGGQALPFFVGEIIVYDVTLPKAGRIGEGSMRVEGPVDVRGTSTYLLRFDSRVRVALMRGVSRSSSWYDPIGRVSLRYFKHEQSPLTRDDESVEIFPENREWKSRDGKTGASPGTQPLDELSFIYFIRTLPLVPGPPQRFDRHFDVARNPVTVQVMRREIIRTPMGELKTYLIEMRVRDPKHFEGEGIIRIHITDDACRLPARIETTMPIVGKAVMTMKSENAPAGCAAR
jgi:hypothetical protein